MIYFLTKERGIYPLAREHGLPPAECGAWLDRGIVPAILVGRTVCRMNAALLARRRSGSNEALIIGAIYGN
jgi:hypothetical protein